MILSGSLIIGDSIKESLLLMAAKRVGHIKYLLNSNIMLFNKKFIQDFQQEAAADVTKLYITSGIASYPAKNLNTGNVQICGVNGDFFKLSLSEKTIKIPEKSILINRFIAEQLNLKTGENINIKIEKPSYLLINSLFDAQKEYISIPVKIHKILEADEFADFSLRLNHLKHSNIFINLNELQNALGFGDKINTILISDKEKQNILNLEQSLNNISLFDSAGLKFKKTAIHDKTDLISDKIFIRKDIVKALTKSNIKAEFILSSFVNSIAKGDKTTPYSFVSASSNNKDLLNDSEVIINQWLSDDLDAHKGDKITFDFFIINDAGELSKKHTELNVASIIPMNHHLNDRSLMPDIPGFSTSGSCSEWDTQMPVDLSKIRKKDEDYWNNYQGTPKAYISLNNAKNLFNNPYGSLTQIRFQDSEKEKLINTINKIVRASDFNLFFKQLKSNQTRGATGGVDFSMLFLGLSFFIILSSLLLTGLYFLMIAEKRKNEIAIFNAIGLHTKHINNIFFKETLCLSIIGVISGILASFLYGKGVIFLLTSVWYDAIKTKEIYLSLKGTTIIISIISTVLISIISMYLSVSFFRKGKIASLLNFNYFSKMPEIYIKRLKQLAYIFTILPIILMLLLLFKHGNGSLIFFLCGFLFLFAGNLHFISFLYKEKVLQKNRLIDFRSISLLNLIRNIIRNALVVFLISTGIFIVVSVSANTRNIKKESLKRNDSGTAGFDYIIELTNKLDSKKLNKIKSLKDLQKNKLFPKDTIIEMHIKDGDDASCRNLNRIETPRILGVDVEALIKRDAFSFNDLIKTDNSYIQKHNWAILKEDYGENIIPAVADLSMIIWGLGKTIGDNVEYRNDYGERIQLKIVGGLKNSMLQGSFIIDKKYFNKHFSSKNGIRLILLDNCNVTNDKDLMQKIKRILRNYGPVIVKAEKRMNEILSIESTYLKMFLILGGLGMIFAFFGLAAIMLKNITARENELAIMQTIGFTKKQVTDIISKEFSYLLKYGIVIGTLSAFVVVTPTLYKNIQDVPILNISIFLLLVSLSGYLAIRMSVFLLFKNNLTSSLRQE